MSLFHQASLTALAWRNIWRQRRRSVLTLSGIAFSCFLFVFATPVQYGAFDSMVDLSLRLFVGHAQIQKQGYLDDPLIEMRIKDVSALAQKLRDSGEYHAISVRAAGFALLSSKQRSYGAQILGVEVENEHQVSGIPNMIKQGHFLRNDNANEVVIGSSLAQNLKVDVGDELVLFGSGIEGAGAYALLNIVGIFSSGDDALDRFMVEIPLQTFQTIFGMPDSAHMIIISAKNPQDREFLPQRLQQDIKDRPDLVVVTWERLVPGLKETWDLKKVGGLIFMLILTVVVVFSIFNTFLMSVLERTKEFGLMLALGASPSKIIRMVMAESFMLSILGIAIGLLMSLPLDFYLANTGFMYPGIEDILKQYNMQVEKIYPQINWFNILLGPSIIFITTNLAAWLPIMRIRNLKPVDAMRTV